MSVFIFVKYTPYNISVMTIQDWAALVLTILSIVALVAGGIKWLTKHYFDEIRAELKPNGGTSLKDAVNRLEADVAHLKDHMLKEEVEQTNMQNKIDRMYEILLDFMANVKK
jgi:hypothetical protein